MFQKQYVKQKIVHNSRLGLTAFQSMEDCAGALDYSLRALESAARTMLTLGR